MRASAGRAAMLVFMCVCSTCSAARGAIEGDVELLRLVANGNKSNLDKIATWTGRAVVSDSHLGDRSRVRTASSSVQLAYDRSQQAKRWNWRVLEADGLPDADAQPALYSKNVMLKGDLAYQLHIPDPAVSDYRRVELLDAASLQISPRGDDFDPLFYLTCRGDDVHDLMMFYYNERNNARIDGKITREADIVTFQRPLADTVDRYRFDLSKQGALVSFSRTEQDVYEEEWDFEYELEGGVWAPKSVTWRHEMEGNQAQERTTLREVIFHKNALNEPVTPAEFSLDKLGLRPGDHVHDQRLDILYRYGDAGRGQDTIPVEALIDASDPTADGGPDGHPRAETPIGAGTAHRAGPEAAERAERNRPAESEEQSRIGTWLPLCVIPGVVLLAACIAVFRKRGRPRATHGG